MAIQSYDYGVSIRLSRIFSAESGKSVIVALDHGVALGAVNGLERLGERLEEVLAGEPEGVLITPGALRRYGYLLAKRTAPAGIVSRDFPLFAYYPGGEPTDGHVPTISAEEAARLGADMVKIVLIFGHERVDHQVDNLSFVSRTVEECHRVGIPVMVEPTTWGARFANQNTKDAHLLADMARIAFEVGADVVKSDIPADPHDMEVLAAACPVPIVLLGGGKNPCVEDMLKDVLVCIQSGAAGVAFGRNVWQHPAPAKMLAAIKKIIHEQDFKAALAALQ